ncbi:hypothetical protein C3Y87_01175 [Carbonactinospora thermoautotrophica]|uniref:Uncharacterized protein n=1 Tax=Carbonactinospora thermoautotrophica TaxID=1469144 RepID=A0A132NFI9_9ACTN|nr:hypothetical protein TH66_10415 [Carbonactinospora thermoautotrophica]KWX08884.1 hypothetical protein TR74_12910 [Carbonactinospora thermoautotrophica]MCX9190045.1 hypothetical protein [Carbonactinospora thermoautotrophica]
MGLPDQRQHEQDHTRPRSMWPRLTRHRLIGMDPVQQDHRGFVNGFVNSLSRRSGLDSADQPALSI